MRSLSRASLLIIVVAACIGAGPRMMLVPPIGWTCSPAGANGVSCKAVNLDGQGLLIAYPSGDAPATPSPDEKWTPAKICGDHPATHKDLHAMMNGNDVQIDAIDATFDGTRVVAMYYRPYGTKANAAAEAALTTLCKPAPN